MPKQYLTQAECRPLLACYKLPLLKSGIATSAEEAAKIVESFGVPVVMKVMSADVVHKFDAGGVLLNIHGARGSHGGLQEDSRQREEGRSQRHDSRHPDRRDGPQGRGSDLGRQPRRPFRTADDVRLGRHAGRSLEGRVVPLGADVANLGRAHGPTASAPSKCSTVSAARRRRISTRSSIRCCGFRRWSATIPRFRSWTSTP